MSGALDEDRLPTQRLRRVGRRDRWPENGLFKVFHEVAVVRVVESSSLGRAEVCLRGFGSGLFPGVRWC